MAGRNMSKQEVLSEAVRVSEQNTETLKRSLQVVEETRAVQAHTLDTLKNQGDQMKRVAGQLEEVDEGVDEAEEVLETMRCCACCFPAKQAVSKRRPKLDNRSGSKPSAHAAVTEELRKRPIDSAQEVENLGAGANSRMQRRPGATSNSADDPAYSRIEAEAQRQDDFLNQIDNALDVMRIGAQDMGSELEGQNKYIEGVQGRAEAVQSRVDDVNRHKVIRRHIKNLD